MALAKPPCQVFQVYLKAQMPEPATQDIEKMKSLSKDQLRKEILKYEKLAIYSEAWKELKIENSMKKLQCLLSFVMQDQDQDGIQDWSAVVDQKISRVVFPLDPDWDNDGTPNPADPNPLRPTPMSSEFPEHLLSQNTITQHWQKKIWQKFKILPIDHTAQHSSLLLKEFYDLLNNGFTNTHWLKNVHWLYAFQKHDAENDIAAYHHSIGAISVGGDLVYTENLSVEDKKKLRLTLAHELGHAFLLENISVSEFVKLSSGYGWEKVFKNHHFKSFYDPLFFESHPQSKFLTDYAAFNAHEWFAENFANSVLFRLGQVNSDAVPDFSNWLRQKLNSF